MGFSVFWFAGGGKAKCRQAGLVVLDHPFGAGGQGRAVMGGVCPRSGWCPLIKPGVNIQSAVWKQKHMEDESFWKAVGLCPACVDPCVDWSGRGQYSCLPVEITCHLVQPWVHCALELRLCNTVPCSLIFLFLMVTPGFSLRRQPRGPGRSRAVSVW